MKNLFVLADIERLIKSYKNATISHDCLAPFLNSFDFETVYETDDNSIVFNAGDKNDISIEFFNFEHPLKREM